MCLFIKMKLLSVHKRSCGSRDTHGALNGLAGCYVVSQTHTEALINLWIALEEGQQCVTWNFRHACTINRCYRHGTTITKQVQSARKIVSSLTVGNDPLVAAIPTSSSHG